LLPDWSVEAGVVPQRNSCQLCRPPQDRGKVPLCIQAIRNSDKIEHVTYKPAAEALNQYHAADGSHGATWRPILVPGAPDDESICLGPSALLEAKSMTDPPPVGEAVSNLFDSIS
jgi:hypothetical protein